MVLDVPLLFESGWDVFCGTVVVVGVLDKGVQMRRLRDREGGNGDGSGKGNGKGNGKGGGEIVEELKGRVGSQGGVLGKVARVLVREGVEVDVDALEALSKGEAGGRGSTVSHRAEVFGQGGGGWGIVLWNDDGSSDDENSTTSTTTTDSNSNNNNDNDKNNTTNPSSAKTRSLSRLRRDVDAIVRQLERRSPQWWAWTLLACPPLAVLAASWCCAWSYWARRKWEGNEGVKRRVEEMEREMLERVEL